MELYYDSAGPRIDSGVAARLRRLDPNLAVTFCRYAIDYRTSRPLEIRNWDGETEHLIERRGGAAYLLEPAYHLWLRSGTRWQYIRSYPAAGGFDHREVYNLEGDVARFMSASQIVRKMLDGEQARRDRRMGNAKQLHDDVVKANWKRIQRLTNADDKSPDRGYRDGKAVSYGGQGNRGTRGTVRKDDREAGWELPERGSY